MAVSLCIPVMHVPLSLRDGIEGDALGMAQRAGQT